MGQVNFFRKLTDSKKRVNFRVGKHIRVNFRVKSVLKISHTQRNIFGITLIQTKAGL